MASWASASGWANQAWSRACVEAAPVATTDEGSLEAKFKKPLGAVVVSLLDTTLSASEPGHKNPPPRALKLLIAPAAMVAGEEGLMVRAVGWAHGSALA
jgi:hypothetical protein